MVKNSQAIKKKHWLKITSFDMRVSSISRLFSMNRHEGVSCDACLKSNLRGRRYKCLICYDYDLCESCYQVNATSLRHTIDHPMQCILTRADYELYYGGEPLNVLETPQAFTCPYCYKMGFTDTLLQEHVSSEHSDASYEVICPVCAAAPGGDPNVITDDLSSHLALEHRFGSRDLISFLDEPVNIRGHNVRRIPHTGRGTSGARNRRSNMYFSASGGLQSLAQSRDTVDPIAELLPQLTDMRHSTTSPGLSATVSQRSHFQHLQRQLQLEHIQVSRQQLDRLPRPQLQVNVPGPVIQPQNQTSQNPMPTTSKESATKHKYLLDEVFAKGSKSGMSEKRRNERSIFIQNLLMVISKIDLSKAKEAKLFLEMKECKAIRRGCHDEELGRVKQKKNMKKNKK